MIRPILRATDPQLRIKSKPVKKFDKKLISLIKDMKDTLEIQDDPEGVGLAAPQIGKSVRVFIFKNGTEIKTVINPNIISIKTLTKINTEVIKKGKKKKTKIMEGCLSLPHYYGPLKRSQEIKISYSDLHGNEKTETFSNFPAQIIQHEIDHLNGVLFIDRIIEQKAPLYEFVDGEWEVVDLLQ